MWISRFRVENFSSFVDSGWVDLDKSFNLFIGPNNSGKSALLKSLNFPLANNPHKNTTVFRGQNLMQPVVNIDVVTTSSEIFDKFLLFSEFPIFPATQGNDPDVRMLLHELSKSDSPIILEFRRIPNSQTTPRTPSSISKFSSPNNQAFFRVKLSEKGPETEGRSGNNTDNLWKLFNGEQSESYFYFDAQRLNIGISSWSSPERLLSNAGNLAAVLAHLQGARRPVFDVIEKHVIDIIGGIDRITVAPRENQYEILLWPDRHSRFEELAFSLNESGTGVGQLLAIVTAMVTSDQSIIIIDEINSYIHPAAVKKLLSLARSEYNHHQYIISSHSADVINSCNAERLYIVTRESFKSTVKAVSLADARHAKEVSSLLGFSMMDVFGHDRLVWVEGPTEEVCFPYLARHNRLMEGGDIGFAPVFATSSFASRSASRSAIEVYEQAGKRLAPLLKGMAFALDRERLSDAEVTKLERSRRKLRFLPRRCMECYLLNPEAVTKIISELDTQDHSLEIVQAAFQVGGEPAYGAPREWTGDLTNPRWLKRVDAARLLEHVFSSVSGNRVEYRKTRDGIGLLRYIAENDADSLKELSDFIAKVLEVAYRDTAP